MTDEAAAIGQAAAVMFGDQLGQAEAFAEILAGPGVERGIIGPAEAARIWDRHLLNCGALAPLIPIRSSVIDVGSGGGLPGIVLAILLPRARLTLLEPMARRVEFLTETRDALGLGNVEVVRGRAEDMAGHLAGDVVTARAVAPLEKLVGLTVGIARSGGIVLAMKGSTAEAELARALPAMRRLRISDARVLRLGGATDAADSSRDGGGHDGDGRAVDGDHGAGGWDGVTATVVTFTVPEHHAAGVGGGRGAGQARAGTAGRGGPARSPAGAAGPRRGRPNSRRGGG